MRASLVVGAVLLTGLAGCAALSVQEREQVALKDGTSVIIFSDGKMSMRDARGLAIQMKDGQAMEARNGRLIVMNGNEVFRRTREEQEFYDLYRGSR